MGSKARAIRWRPLRPFVGTRNDDSRLRIYGREDFLQLLHYERVRADRGNTEFSLVVFEVKNVLLGKKKVMEFVDMIRDNVRSVDHVGWFEEGIGVLLPITCRANAIKFARAILKRAISEVIPFAIYSYPESTDKARQALDSGDAIRLERTEKTQDPAQEAMVLYDPTGGRLRVGERLKSVFASGIPAWKRGLDLVGAVVGLLLLSPMFLVLAIYIRLVSPGPVFYRSTRIGLRGKSFTFLKFRTMHTGNHQVFHGTKVKELIHTGGAWAKMDDRDPRIIPGGKLLRKLAIDELPQLINIVKGEMSIVGPRPCIPYEAEEFLRWHTHRFDIVPGLTGLWQVSGKDVLSFQEMIRLDIEYTRSLSLSRDLAIILRTPFAIMGLVIRALQRKIPGPESDQSAALNA